MEESDISKKIGLNDYTINGDIATIYIYKKNGEVIETIVDACKLEKLKTLNYRWSADWREAIQNYYIRASVYVYGRKSNKMFYLHQIITDSTSKKHYVDHINHNTLDNRLENLRVSSVSENSAHRKSKNRNNSSGFRNVFWNTSLQKWSVTLSKNYHQIKIGDFNDLIEAAHAAMLAREKYYGEYAGSD